MQNNLIRFKIDEKSLFIGETNDYKKGQTATVSTPLNQNSNPNKWRNDILNLKKANCRVGDDVIPEMLTRKCLSHSKAGCRIDDVFVFDNFTLDGVTLKSDYQFAMYIKREIDEKKVLSGILQKNVHLNRLKLHYPISFNFSTDNFNIDNNKVLNTIMEQNGGFAYVVRGFEYDQDRRILNIITSLIGPKGIPLSSVFRRKKGVGQKLLIDETKVVGNDYIFVVEQHAELNRTSVYYELVNRSCSDNGKLGEEKVYKLLLDKLDENRELYHTSLNYPQSPYDMEYFENGIKKYVEVKSTQGNKPIFNMSSGEIKFMEKYKDNYILYMVTNVKDEFPKFDVYTYNDIKKMRKEYLSARFYA